MFQCCSTFCLTTFECWLGRTLVPRTPPPLRRLLQLSSFPVQESKRPSCPVANIHQFFGTLTDILTMGSLTCCHRCEDLEYWVENFGSCSGCKALELARISPDMPAADASITYGLDEYHVDSENGVEGAQGVEYLSSGETAQNSLHLDSKFQWDDFQTMQASCLPFLDSPTSQNLPGLWQLGCDRRRCC